MFLLDLPQRLPLWAEALWIRALSDTDEAHYRALGLQLAAWELPLFARARDLDASDERLLLGVAAANDDALVGLFQLEVREVPASRTTEATAPGSVEVEVSLVIDGEWRRTGVGAAAMRALVALLHEQRWCAAVRLRIAPDNLPARALADRLGFRLVDARGADHVFISR